MILIIIAKELILLAISVILTYISSIHDDMTGIFLSYIILPLAGSESAIALSLIIKYYPRRGTLVI